MLPTFPGGILRGTRKERLLSKFVENECEKIDRLMELYLRYSDRVKVEMERLNQIELEDLEMDEEEKYNRKLESGLYTLQLVAVILGHLWCSDSALNLNTVSGHNPLLLTPSSYKIVPYKGTVTGVRPWDLGYSFEGSKKLALLQGLKEVRPSVLWVNGNIFTSDRTCSG
ncbi:beta-catenin-like protein 1 [Cucumis melo var. makuwa]|uniref:Beta-catenin-like protein 1 n=1 Tax=Cucumis melo var. makuwa TaxID=1194695 RepID=A0A5A7TRM7_CUCMM|nr:beta-catenin-like protein 1 [Cucumis melo var. makuwa]